MREVWLAVLSRLMRAAHLSSMPSMQSRRAQLDRRDERLAWELTLGVDDGAVGG